MLSLGDILLLLVLALTLFLAVAAIVHGYKGLRVSRNFSADRKVQVGYWMASAIHLGTGILITVCYIVTFVMFLISYTSSIGV